MIRRAEFDQRRPHSVVSEPISVRLTSTRGRYKLLDMSQAADEAQPSDAHLVDAISQRAQSQRNWESALGAYETLYHRHSGRLLLFLAARVARDDIEDVHQVVWQRAWQHIPHQFVTGNLRAWLLQIARNEIVDRHRKRRAARLEEPDEFADPRSFESGSELIESERIQALKRCLNRLDNELSVVVRKRLSGASYDSICAEVGVDAAKAYKMFHRAKKQLTHCVQQATE